MKRKKYIVVYSDNAGWEPYDLPNYYLYKWNKKLGAYKKLYVRADAPPEQSPPFRTQKEAATRCKELNQDD